MAGCVAERPAPGSFKQFELLAGHSGTQGASSGPSENQGTRFKGHPEVDTVVSLGILFSYDIMTIRNYEEAYFCYRSKGIT